jgi:hypothetical protein
MIEEEEEVNGLDNPYYSICLKYCDLLSGEVSFFADSLAKRSRQWNKIDKVFGKLCSHYAWAVPDERALNILQQFSPIIEIGAGKGYWAKLLRNRGVDIIAYDKFVNTSKCWTNIVRGGPETLISPVHVKRNLFLCYPDEDESISIYCLENFRGEYIVHVGETIFSGYFFFIIFLF